MLSPVEQLMLWAIEAGCKERKRKKRAKLVAKMLEIAERETSGPTPMSAAGVSRVKAEARALLHDHLPRLLG